MLSHSGLDIGLGLLLAVAVALLVLPLAHRRSTRSKPAASESSADSTSEIELIKSRAHTDFAALAAKTPEHVRDKNNGVAVARKRRTSTRITPRTSARADRDAEPQSVAPQLPTAHGLAIVEERGPHGANEAATFTPAKASEDTWRRGHSDNSLAASADEATKNDTWTRDRSVIDASLVPTIEGAADHDTWTRGEAHGTPAEQPAINNRLASALSRIDTVD